MPYHSPYNQKPGAHPIRVSWMGAPSERAAFPVTSDEMIAKAMPVRRRSSRKGENGVVTVVGGSWLYHGAPTLSALAALRTGADLAYVAVPKTVSTAVRAISPALIVLPLPDSKLTTGCVNRLLSWLPKIDSLALGPGMGNQRTMGMEKLVTELAVKGVKIVLDADALTPTLVNKVKGVPSVITPHQGEFKRVFGEEAPSDMTKRTELVQRKARDADTVILLKGRVDIVSDGDKVILNKSGTPAMTVGGTGDILTGIVAGLLARNSPPLEAAYTAAYVNGLAGEGAVSRLGIDLVATDILEELPRSTSKFARIVE